VTAPRFITNHFLGSFRQKPPTLGSLILSTGFDPATVDELKARGHEATVARPPLASNPCVLSIDRRSGLIRAAGDPAAGRHAGAY
jgi:gamma-glutamyltranspeptidase / glutathione hydrolase